MFVDYIVLPLGDNKWLLKKIIVIESFIQEIRSKSEVFMSVSLNHSFALFNNSVKLLNFFNRMRQFIFSHNL